MSDIHDAVAKLIREHELATEKLTEQQLAEAIRQALKAGDFVRHVRMSDGFTVAQAVVYMPCAELDRCRAELSQLRAAATQLLDKIMTSPLCDLKVAMDEMIQTLERGQ